MSDDRGQIAKLEDEAPVLTSVICLLFSVLCISLTPEP